ncbi:hypothetical protein D3C78_856800 [compost metagenome]
MQGLDRTIIGHEFVGATAAVQIQRAVGVGALQVVARGLFRTVRRRAAAVQGKHETAVAIAAGHAQGAQRVGEGVVRGRVRIRGDHRSHLRLVLRSIKGDGQVLGCGSAGAVGHLEREAIAGARLKCFDRRIEGDKLIGAAGVQVQRAIGANQLLAVAVQAYGVTTGLDAHVIDRVGRRFVGIAVGRRQRAGHVGEAVILCGVGVGVFRQRGREFRGVIDAVQGDGDRLRRAVGCAVCGMDHEVHQLGGLQGLHRTVVGHELVVTAGRIEEEGAIGRALLNVEARILFRTVRRGRGVHQHEAHRVAVGVVAAQLAGHVGIGVIRSRVGHRAASHHRQGRSLVAAAQQGAAGIDELAVAAERTVTGRANADRQQRRIAAQQGGD